MSEQEQPKSFMQKVDDWTQSLIINPLQEVLVEGNGDECDAVCRDIKKAIREKVLDSYKNGLKAQGQPKPQRAYKPRGK